MCPDCSVYRFVGIEVRKQHLEVLSCDHSGNDGGAIVDESVVKANGLRRCVPKGGQIDPRRRRDRVACRSISAMRLSKSINLQPRRSSSK